MKASLVQILCCPHCKHDLLVHTDLGSCDGIEEGRLTCTGCHASYPIRRGVPRFVTDDDYAGSFSYEWNKWNRVQLDSAHGGHASDEAFRHKTGLTPADLAGKVVLDVGCGAGRFLDVASTWGSRTIGVDFSLAVDAAQRNVGQRPNVDVVQADVFRLPFRREVFDVIFSLGVLHHTPDTRGAFLALPPHLKEGGTLAVWLYYYADRLYTQSTDFWRRLLRPLPNQALYAWSAFIAAVAYPMYRLPFMTRYPWSLLPRLLPMSMHDDWHWRVLDTFDWYSPLHQDKDCSPTRVVSWCRDANLREIVLLDFPMSMRAVKDSRGVRPFFKALPELRNRRIVVFGAGAGGRRALDRLAALGVAHHVVAVCDNDPSKRGRRVNSHIVTTFEALPRDSYDHVVIASQHGWPAIAAQLSDAGLETLRDFSESDTLDEFAPLLRLATLQS